MPSMKKAWAPRNGGEMAALIASPLFYAAYRLADDFIRTEAKEVAVEVVDETVKPTSRKGSTANAA